MLRTLHTPALKLLFKFNKFTKIHSPCSSSFLGLDINSPKSFLNQVLEQVVPDFKRLTYSQPLEFNLGVPGYIQKVNATIGVVIAFNKDQLNEDLNDKIEEFSSLLNKAYKLKQRETTAKAIIS